MSKAVAKDFQDFVGIGLVGSPRQTYVIIEDKPISLIKEYVTPHPPFDDPRHIIAKIAQSSDLVFVDGQGIAREGDRATCGHAIRVVQPPFVFSD